jgi:hypothetical protein
VLGYSSFLTTSCFLLFLLFQEFGYQQNSNNYNKDSLLDRFATSNNSIQTTINMCTEKVAKTLNIPISWSELLLNHFNWKPENVIQNFENDPENACQMAGLPYRKLYRARQLAIDGMQNYGLRQPTLPAEEENDDDKKKKMNNEDCCLICYNGDQILRGLGCKHQFVFC